MPLRRISFARGAGLWRILPVSSSFIPDTCTARWVPYSHATFAITRQSRRLSSTCITGRPVHSEEKRFKCDYPSCGFRTHHVFSLEQHLLTHELGLERQLPFVCKFPNCDFRRRSRAEMNSHEKLHLSSQDRFKCKLCPNMSYPDRRSLDFHQCQNHSKKASKCQLCGFSFRQKRALRVHQQKCHNSSQCRVAPTNSNRVNTCHCPDDNDKPTCRNYPVNTLSPDSVRCFKECAGLTVAVQYEISTFPVVLLPRMHLTVL